VTQPPTPTAGLLLAAGAGTRLGTPKALVPGLLDRGVALLRDAGLDPVLVVLGAAVVEVPDAQVVVAPDWEEGLSASLRAGLAALEATAAQACVVALVDQPVVGVEAVRRLVAVPPGTEAAVATYAGQQRNPVLLARAVWAEVAAAARGDSGARSWLRSHPERVVQVPCDGTGSPDDVDTPADAQRLLPGHPG
jgi:CTP:molybdopterin cytidylyltransferase MocA